MLKRLRNCAPRRGLSGRWPKTENIVRHGSTIVVADVCSQFLMNRRQIERYQQLLPMTFERVHRSFCWGNVPSSYETLQFLVKVGVDNSLDLLSNFSFYRFYHVSKTQKRSFRGMMSWNVLLTAKDHIITINTQGSESLLLWAKVRC